MITLKVSLAGTDENGKSFSAAPGDVVSLDKKSEANCIKAGYATAAKRAPAKRAPKKSAKK